MTALTENFDGKLPSWDEFSALFEDETGFPVSICRAQVGVSKSATLFNIVMDLKSMKAIVKLGRPCAVEEVVELSFEVQGQR
jgi:isopenicillin-N N-acyltransferase-like protein